MASERRKPARWRRADEPQPGWNHEWGWAHRPGWELRRDGVRLAVVWQTRRDGSEFSWRAGHDSGTTTSVHEAQKQAKESAVRAETAEVPRG